MGTWISSTCWLIVTNAAVNMGIKNVCFRPHFQLKYISRRDLFLDHMVIVSFWRITIVFSKSSYTISHSQHKGSRIPIPPRPHQYLLFLFFLKNNNCPNGTVKRYLILVFICTQLFWRYVCPDERMNRILLNTSLAWFVNCQFLYTWHGFSICTLPWNLGLSCFSCSVLAKHKKKRAYGIKARSPCLSSSCFNNFLWRNIMKNNVQSKFIHIETCWYVLKDFLQYISFSLNSTFKLH